MSAALTHDVLNPDAPALSGGGAQGASAPTTPVGTANLTLSQAVLDVGALRGLSAASAARRSASATLEDTRRRLTQGLARSLVAVVAAERVAEERAVGWDTGRGAPEGGMPVFDNCCQRQACRQA